MIQAAPGRIAHIEGLEKAQRLPCIEAVLVQRHVGDLVRPLAGNYDVPGYVVARGATRAEAQDTLDRFDSVCRIATEADKP